MPPTREATYTAKLSYSDIRALQSILAGTAGNIPAAQLERLTGAGLVERKFGGPVLTAVGRYQLDRRSRESGLSLLASRWRRRAEQLTQIHDSMSAERDPTLVHLAQRWKEVARHVDEIASLERASPSLV